jgi:phosphatidylserine/phosphatidylglycerophosphate/cardiolipin synthase-like enzyme
MIKRAERKI